MYVHTYDISDDHYRYVPVYKITLIMYFKIFKDMKN